MKEKFRLWLRKWLDIPQLEAELNNLDDAVELQESKLDSLDSELNDKVETADFNAEVTNLQKEIETLRNELQG